MLDQLFLFGYCRLDMPNVLAVAGPNSKYKLPDATPAGFWAGLWHGISLRFSFGSACSSPAFGSTKPTTRDGDTISGSSSVSALGHRITKQVGQCTTPITKEPVTAARKDRRSAAARGLPSPAVRAVPSGWASARPPKPDIPRSTDAVCRRSSCRRAASRRCPPACR